MIYFKKVIEKVRSLKPIWVTLVTMAATIAAHAHGSGLDAALDTPELHEDAGQVAK